MVSVEVEVIEQIEEEDQGRSLAWVCDLIRGLSRDEPMAVLRGMWQGGYVGLLADSGEALPRWRCAELFRTGDANAPVRVVATDHGSRWVHG